MDISNFDVNNILECKFLTEDKPEEGKPVLVYVDEGNHKIFTVAYREGDSFYNLKLDDVLGVLRKNYISGTIICYAYIPVFKNDLYNNSK